MKTKIRFLPLLLLAAFMLTLIKPFPAMAVPSVYSKYYCLVDGVTGQLILAKNANQPRQIASTTKIMTAILALEYADMDEVATVSPIAAKTAEYTIGLRSGQNITLQELMKASLIKSSNDAAAVIGEHIAGDEEFFAQLMTKKAFAIGAMHTYFKNASGLPDDESHSTAYDLSLMGRYALTKPLIGKLAATKQTEFKHPGYLQPMTIRNTNTLIGSYAGATGLKTGTANEAGKCLIATATRDGRKLIAVVLKSGDRAGDCRRLLDYGFKETARCQLIDSREVFKNAKINNGKESYAEIIPARDLYIWQGDGKIDVQKMVRMNYQLEAPLPAGYKVGEMDVYIGDQYYTTIDLITNKNVPKEAGLIKKIFHLGKQE